MSTFDTPETECWAGRYGPWRPAGRVRASAHMNMHSDRSSVKVIKVIIWACWENTWLLQGEMITPLLKIFCLSWDWKW